MIPYSKQYIDKKDIENVKKVLKSNFLTQGPNVKKFENIVKKKCNAKFATAVNSATSALHLSCIALNLKKGDYLWTSPNSFVASANCGLYCGAKIDFVDISLDTYNIDVDILEEKLIYAKKKKVLPKIIVAVHMGGLSCEMKKINSLSKKYGFKIIEDASHCVGSKFRNKFVGSCKYSDISVFSFHPVKIITTGEGGIILTNNKNLNDKVNILRTSGINKNLKKNKILKNGLWFYEQEMLGFNYRMNDISASLGISQMKKLNFFLKKRNQIAQIYIKSLNNHEIKFQLVKKEYYSSYHLFIIRVNKNIRRMLFNKLRKKGYYVNIHYIPIHFHPYYRKLGFKKGMFPNSEKYYDEAISLPIYPNLTKKHLLKIIKIVKSFVNKK